MNDVLKQIFTNCYFLKEITKEKLTQKVLFLRKERHTKRCCSLEGTTSVPCKEPQIKIHVDGVVPCRE